MTIHVNNEICYDTNNRFGGTWTRPCLLIHDYLVSALNKTSGEKLNVSITVEMSKLKRNYFQKTLINLANLHIRVPNVSETNIVC